MNNPQRNSLTDTSKILIDWLPLSAPLNGNSDVTSYSLEFDQGSNQNSWISLCGYLTDYTELTYTVS
jgi:hypothetical protein